MDAWEARAQAVVCGDRGFLYGSLSRVLYFSVTIIIRLPMMVSVS